MEANVKRRKLVPVIPLPQYRKILAVSPSQVKKFRGGEPPVPREGLGAMGGSPFRHDRPARPTRRRAWSISRDGTGGREVRPTTAGTREGRQRCPRPSQ